MSIALTPENKNTIALTGETKPSPTWDTQTNTWNDAAGTWDVPGTVLTAETKNTISLAAEAKH